MRAILHDLRVVVRGLGRSRFFAIVSIVTIALATGVAGSVFSVVDTLILRSLPYPDANRLVMVRTGLQQQTDFPMSNAEYLDYRNDSKVAAAVGAWASDTTTARIGNGDPEVVSFARITPGVQSILGLTTAIGRPFTDADGAPDGPPVVLLSYGYWKSHFGGDPSVVEGRTLQLGGTPYAIAGVVAKGFSLPGASPAIYQPIQLPGTSEQLESRSGHYLNVVARLRAGATLGEARAEAGRLMQRWDREFRGEHVLTPDSHPMKIRRLAEWALGSVWKSIRLIVWAAALVVLLACTNLSTLMLARAETRKVDLGVRRAFGARFGALVRNAMVESITIALAGGALGIVLSAGILKWIGTQSVGSMQVGASHLDASGVDLRLALFTVVLAAASGIVFGLLPAIAAKRVDVTRLLARAGGRSGTGSRRLRRSFNAMVFVQLALAAVLLNGTVMLINGFTRASRIDPGFAPNNRLAVALRLSSADYPDGEPVIRFYDRLLDAIRTIPGVESAAAARALPMRQPLGTEAFIHAGQVWHDGDPASQVDFQTVSPGYDRTMGIAVLAGREFDERDRADSPRVAMLNRAAAVAYFGSVHAALGKRIVPLFMGGPQADPFTIVGISENVRQLGLIGDVRPEIELPIAQARGWVFGVLRRGELVVHVKPGMEASVLAGIRATLGKIAPGVPIADPGTMSEALRASTAYQRLLTELTTGFGIVALLIAGVGVLGIAWFGVNTRWRELGVRMALGQTGASVTRMVLGQGLRLGLGGALIGIAATAGIERIVHAAIPVPGVVSPVLLAVSTVVLVAFAGLACLGPALQAGRLDPATILSAE